MKRALVHTRTIPAGLMRGIALLCVGLAILGMLSELRGQFVEFYKRIPEIVIFKAGFLECALEMWISLLLILSGLWTAKALLQTPPASGADRLKGYLWVTVFLLFCSSVPTVLPALPLSIKVMVSSLVMVSAVQVIALGSIKLAREPKINSDRPDAVAA